jgi:hypothetical protein
LRNADFGLRIYRKLIEGSAALILLQSAIRNPHSTIRMAAPPRLRPKTPVPKVGQEAAQAGASRRKALAGFGRNPAGGFENAASNPVLLPPPDGRAPEVLAAHERGPRTPQLLPF